MVKSKYCSISKNWFNLGTLVAASTALSKLLSCFQVLPLQGTPQRSSDIAKKIVWQGKRKLNVNETPKQIC